MKEATRSPSSSTRASSATRTGVKHVGDYPCPDDVQPGEVLPILIKEGTVGCHPPTRTEKDVVFVTVPRAVEKETTFPFGEWRRDGPGGQCPPGKKPGDVVGVKVTEEDRKRMKEGADRRESADELQEICHALPVCLDFGGKDVADLLAGRGHYQEQAERTASIANARTSTGALRGGAAAVRKGVRKIRDKRRRKSASSKRDANTRRKLEAKLAGQAHPRTPRSRNRDWWRLVRRK